MRIHFTQNSEDNLAEIYAYQCEGYSESYADSFYDAITEFVIKNLSAHQKLGHEYNPDKGIYRLIFKKRYNIYYLIQDGTIFILNILDGPVSLNAELAEPDAPIPLLD